MEEPELDAAASLLLTHWDVVGVADSDVQPEQEYFYEARQVLALLADGADVTAVAAYLSGQAEQISGANPDRDKAAASALVEWYRNSR